MDEEIVSGAFSIRTGLAEARDRAIDEARELGGKLFIAEAIFREAAGFEVFNQDMRFGDELACDRLTFWRRDIERDGAFIAVGAMEVRTFCGVVAIGVFDTTEHPDEAVQAVYYLAAVPELVEVWVGTFGLPAIASLHSAYLNKVDELFPWGVDWQVVVDSLDYPDIPSHESWMPLLWRARSRVQGFQTVLEGRSDLNVDAAIDELVEDLQDIFDAA